MDQHMLSHTRLIWVTSLVAATLACRRTAEQPASTDAQPPSTHAPPPSADGQPPSPTGGDMGTDAAATEETDTLATRFLRGPIPGDAPFEGEIIFRVSMLTGPDNVPAKYSFIMKGNKIRWDLAGDGGKGESAGYRIYDSKEHKFYSVMHAPFVYVTKASMLLGDPGAASKYTLRPFAPEPKGAVQGVPCKRMQTEDDRFHYSFCVASGMPTIPLNALGHGLDVVVPFGELLEMSGQFPLDVVVREPKLRIADSGTPPRGPAQWHATLKVLKVTRAKVSDAAFDLPGYKIVEAPNLSPAVPLR